MKTISTNAQTKIDTAQGSEPVLIVRIEWPTPTGEKFYGEKLLTDVDYGNILNVSGFSDSFTVGSVNNVGSVSVLLDDSAGDLKTLLDTHNILGCSAECYVAYTSITTDGIQLIKGKIGGPIVWSEGDRTLSFNIISDWGHRTAGFSLRDDDTVNGTLISPLKAAIGTAWPMCFGSALRVPAVKIVAPFVAELEEDLRLTSDESEVRIKYEENPPSNEQSYSIEGIKCTGTIEDNVLTIPAGKMNEKWYTYVSIESRSLHSGDEDEDNHSVLWISDPSIKLTNKYCYTGNGFKKCLRQDGKKCWFTSDWYTDDEDQPTVFLEVRGWPSESWTGYTTNSAINTVLMAGDRVFWVDDPNPDIVYIANMFHSTEIKEVMAYRSLGEQNKKELVAVPSSRYTVDKNYPVPDRYKTNNPNANTVCTAIIFSTGLHEYVDEHWDDNVIYVSLISHLLENVVSTIDTLFIYYSDLSKDSDSFLSAFGAVGKYPIHGYISEELNVLDLVENIAWQSRLGIFIHNNTVYYKYLSKAPTSGVYTLTEDQTINKSIIISLTDDTDLVTNAKAYWALEGSQEKKYELVLTNNVDEYGDKKSEFNFYIYNIKSLVEKSLQFWLNRYSNVWKILNVSTPLPLIGVDVGDYIKIDYSNNPIASTSIYGLVTNLTYDTDSHLLTYNIWTPVKAGETSVSSEAFLNDTGDVKPDDPIYKRSQVDYVPEIYVRSDYGSILTNTSEKKPSVSWSYVYFAKVINVSGLTDSPPHIRVNFYDKEDNEQTSGNYSNVTVICQTSNNSNGLVCMPRMQVGQPVMVAKHSDNWYYLGNLLTTVYRG